MDIYSEIKQKIKNIKSGQQTILFTAEVISVDGDTCVVDFYGLQVSDVRLRSVINGENEKILITPKVGSYVLIADLSAGDCRDFAVLKYSEVESVNITVGGENLFTVLSDLITEVQKIIVIQGTSPNVPALEQIKQRLNKILK